MLDDLKEKQEEIKEEVNEEQPASNPTTATTSGLDEGSAEAGDTLTPNATEEENQGQEAAPEDTSVEEESTPHQEEPQEKLLTQSQVNELVGRARQEGRQAALKELLERYGVNDENEMNDVFGKGQSYDILNQEYDTQGNAYRSAMSENALLKSHIDDSRWEDVKAILGAKGLEITPENIESLIPSHPEWRGQVMAQEAAEGTKMFSPEMGEALAKQQAMAQPQETPAVLRKLGSDPQPVEVDEKTEEQKAKEIFGL